MGDQVLLLLIAEKVLLTIVILIFISIIATITKRFQNNAIEDQMRCILPIFEQLTQPSLSSSDRAKLIQTSLRKRNFKLFERFLRIRIGKISSLDVALYREIADISGFTSYCKANALKKDTWDSAIAVKTIGSLRDPHNIPLLKAILLKSTFIPARQAAALSLAQCGVTDFLPQIIASTCSPENPNRDTTLSIFFAFGEPCLEPLLSLFSTDSLSLVQETTIIDFMRVKEYHPARKHILKKLSVRNQKDLFIHAIEALGVIGEKEDIATIRTFLLDSDFRVRIKAVVATIQLGKQDARNIAEEALCDPDWWVRRNAAEGLIALGEQGIEILEQHALDFSSTPGKTARMILAESQFNRKRFRYRFD